MNSNKHLLRISLHKLRLPGSNAESETVSMQLRFDSAWIGCRLVFFPLKFPKLSRLATDDIFLTCLIFMQKIKVKSFPIFYRFIRLVVKFAMSIVFQKIELQNGENAPARGPVIFVANHPNSIMDALVMGLVTKRKVNYIGHAGLFSNKFKSWFLRSSGVILSTGVRMRQAKWVKMSSAPPQSPARRRRHPRRLPGAALDLGCRVYRANDKGPCIASGRE